MTSHGLHGLGRHGLHVLAASAVFAVACGGAIDTIDATHGDGGHSGVSFGNDGGDLPAPPSRDGGRPDGNVTPDGGFFDALPDVPDAPGPHHARLQFINATTTFGGARLCLATGALSDGSDTAVAPLPALPHDDAHPMPGTTWPGVAAGSAETVPDLTDFSHKAITPFLVAAEKIKGEVRSNPNEVTCDTLIGPRGTAGRLTEGVDYVRLPTIPVGTLLNGGSFALAIYDCDPNAMGQSGCTTRTFDTKLFTLETRIASTTTTNVGVLNLSTSLAIRAPGGVDVKHDACGNWSLVVHAQRFGEPDPFLSLLAIASTNPCDVVSFTAARADTTIAFTSTPEPIARIEALSNRVAFAPGKNFTLVVLGDPAFAEATLPSGATNAAYDGRGIHVIALSHDPVLPPL